MSYSEHLKHTELFTDLTEDDLEVISELFTEKICPKGTLLFKENDDGDKFYIVLKGKVGINISSDEKDEKIQISYAEEYQLVGEFCLVDNENRSAAAVCEKDSIILVAKKENLLNLMDQNKEIGFTIMKNLATILCDRLKTTNMRWKNSVLFFSIRNK